MTTDATQDSNASAAPAAAPAISGQPSAPAADPASPPVSPEPAAPVEGTPPITPAPEAPPTEVEKPADKSLLGEEPAKEEPKPVEPSKEGDKTPEQKDAPPEGEQKKEEGSQSAEPAPLPTYEFTLPEGFQPDDTKFEEFKKKIGAFELDSKADHAKFQSFSQDLLNQHTAALQETVERLNNYYSEAFEKQGSDWKDAFEKDPDIGGNRRDTTLKAAKHFIRTFGGTEDQQQQFLTLMDETKIGNHPALIRMLANAGTVLAEGKPVPATQPFSAPQSKVARRYAATS